MHSCNTNKAKPHKLTNCTYNMHQQQTLTTKQLPPPPPSRHSLLMKRYQLPSNLTTPLLLASSRLPHRLLLHRPYVPLQAVTVALSSPEAPHYSLSSSSDEGQRRGLLNTCSNNELRLLEMSEKFVKKKNSLKPQKLSQNTSLKLLVLGDKTSLIHKIPSFVIF